MHIVHLAVGTDLLAGMLQQITDDTSVFQARFREGRLGLAWEEYRAWAERAKVRDRAGRRLFTSAVLSNTKVVEVSQKVLNATSCRYMLLWAATFMTSICEKQQGLSKVYTLPVCTSQLFVLRVVRMHACVDLLFVFYCTHVHAGT